MVDPELKRLENMAQQISDGILSSSDDDDVDNNNAIEKLALIERTITERKKVLEEARQAKAKEEAEKKKLELEAKRVENEARQAKAKEEAEKKKLLEEARQAKAKEEAEKKKLELEAKRVENEAPKKPTKFQKVVDFGKAWGGVIAGGLGLGGIVIHEVINRKNLDQVGKFEETGTWRSTAFRKFIK